MNDVEALQERYDTWLKDAKNGLSDPNYPDGYNMNFVRNHIIFLKKRITGNLPVCQLPIPPLVPDGYMVKGKKEQERRWELLSGNWNLTTEKTFDFNEDDFVYEAYASPEQLSFNFQKNILEKNIGFENREIRFFFLCH